jgi:hypothetical protein
MSAGCEPFWRRLTANLPVSITGNGAITGTVTRHLFNKLLGQLYHCLQTQQTFGGTQAFPALQSAAA